MEKAESMRFLITQMASAFGAKVLVKSSNEKTQLTSQAN